MEELKYFFSYSRKDSEFVLRLAKELRAAGANVWLDQLDILGGEHWDDTIQKALKSCKGVIAVLSPESVASSNMMDEVSYALDEGKLVVPVLIRPCEIPFRLRRLQHIDSSGDYDTGFTQLLRALHIEQPLEPPESAAVEEPVVQDSAAPPEAEPAGPPVREEQAAQEVEKLLSPEVSESTPSTPEDAKPTGALTEKAPLASHKTKVSATICIVAFVAIISIVCLLTIYFKNYHLTVEAVGGSVEVTAVDGSVVKDPNQASYRRGANLVLRALPGPTYRFDEWSGALSDSNNPATLAMDADKLVTAKFIKTYSLTVAAVNGSIDKSPDEARYDHGTTVALTAVPDPNCRFEEWSDDLSGDNESLKLLMDADKSVTASFIKTYSLTVTAVNGSVDKSPDEGRYDHGKTVTLTVVPEPNSMFEEWSGDLSGPNETPTLVMDANKSVTANFVKTYSLIVSAVGGSVTKDPDKLRYKDGASVALAVVPEPNYMFEEWSGDLSGPNETPTLVMDEDKTVTARFTLKTYGLTVEAVGGSITKSPDQARYEHGEKVILKAVPEEGYIFTSWSGAMSDSNDPSITLVMDADKTVTASFALRARSASTNSKRVTPPPSSNDNCKNSMETGEVKNLPFDTSDTTFDGPGPCMTSPNIWYCYTALCTGDVTVSLAGSSFDTMLAVYDGCEYPTPNNLIKCNDDVGGSYQSAITLAAIAGKKYLIEIGGFASETGVGILNISYEWGGSRPLCEDVNGDGVIDMKDLTTLTALWLEHCSDRVAEPNCLCRDVNGNGAIDLEDLSALTELWLEKCDPKQDVPDQNSR